MKKVILLTLIFAVSSCSTQRYGREQEVSSFERAELDCKQIKLEIAKTESFLSDLRIKRADTNIMHVAGALGDFGIGNSLEGDAAEKSGEIRLKQLKDLNVEKKCNI